MTSNPRALAGLGIDMGPPEPPTAPLHVSRPRTGPQNDNRRSASQLPRRPPMSSSGASSSADERRVRIASGQPGVMGHEDSETEDSASCLSSPDSMTTSSGNGEGRRYSSGPMNRNKRLGAAVAAMSSGSSSSRYDSTPSDMYSSDTSPTTDSSATSYNSLRSKGSNSSLKREFTIRKQRSQPNLSRTSTVASRGGLAGGMGARSGISNGPPPASSSGMGRSKSSLSLSSQFLSSETGSDSGTSLGRTSEIPRSGSRSGLAFAGRGRGRGGGSLNRPSGRRNSYSSSNSSAQLRGPSVVAATAAKQESRLIPDGFGGYVEADRAATQMKPPSEVDPNSPAHLQQPPTTSQAQQRQQQQQQQQQQQPQRQQQHQLQQQQRQQQPQPRSQLPGPRPVQHQRLKSESSVQGQKAFDGPATLRVGSFYGPDGSETARLDAEGRLSRSATSRTRSSSTTSRPRTAPLQATAPESSAGQAHSVVSSQRSNSSGPPKPRFMTSPGNNGNGAADTALDDRNGDVEAKDRDEVNTKRGNQGLHKSTSQMSMRSERGWKGLDGAERGEAMVSLDRLNSTFDQGETIMPGRVKTSVEDSILASARLSQTDPEEHHRDPSSTMGGRQQHKRQMSAPMMLNEEAVRSNVSLLDRQPTLISTSATPARRSRELSRLLANSNRKVASSSASSSGASSAGESMISGSTDSLATTKTQAALPPAVLEQGRQGKARVDVDLVLESDLVVEGGILRGRLEIKVRKNNDKDGPLMLTHPKVRVVGFEELLNDDTRHIFYHHATVVYGERKVGGPARPYVLHGTPSLSSPEADGGWEPLPCFDSHPDSEGFCRGKEGTHSIPFSLEMPVGKGAKGSYRGKHALVRYIVIGSVKLKSNGSNPNRSIAHFYRHVELYPYLNPAVVLSSAHRPVQARASKGLFLGGSGKVHLTASLHRTTWVAGQRVYVNVNVQNDTSKKVKSLTLALVRTVTLYRPRPEFDMGGISAPDDPTDTYVDPDACTTSTSRKKISEEVLEMGQKGSKGVVTARGWWTGVEGGGGAIDFSHYMNLPQDALTVSRGRHVEVLYSIKVSVSSSLSADVSVELPLRVVNFVSLDPPPIKNTSSNVAARSWNGVSSRGQSSDRNAMSDSEAPNIAKIRSVEALRSPSARIDHGLGITSAIEPTYPVLHANNALMPPPPQQPHLHPQQQPRAQLGQPLQAKQQHLQVDSRRLQHQKSLDFINHAIRSATARRGGQAASSNGNSTGDEVSPPMGLGISVDERGETTPSQRSIASSATGPSDPSCAPYVHVYGQTMPFSVPTTAVSLDDLADDDSDGEDEAEADRTLGLNDDSVDEVDLVIGSARLEGESTPAWESRQSRFGTSGDESSDTISSATGIKEEDDDDDNGYNDDDDDDFDEEEERAKRRTETVHEEEREYEEAEAEETDYSEYEAPRQALQHHQTRRVSAEADRSYDDGPTPVARSPPKFQSQSGSAAAKLAIPRASSNVDLKQQRNKSTAAIPGGVRPISPSKNAPSPTKSALKSKSSFTFATSDSPLKVSPNPTTQKLQNASTVKPTLRAKVEPNQLAPTNEKANRGSVQSMSPKRAVLASNNTKNKKSNSAAIKAPEDSPMGSVSSLDTASPSSLATSDDELRTPESAHLSELPTSDSSKTIMPDDASHEARGLGLDFGGDTAPARPKVSSIPRPAASATARKASGGRREGFVRENSAPPTVRPLGPVAQKSPSKEETMSKSMSMAAIPRPDSTNGSSGGGGGGEGQKSLERSTSTHNLRGSSVVLPSVRDKIAQLEQRKKALNDFTTVEGGGGLGTPTRLGTPTKGQHRGLERQESFLSETSTDVSSTPSFVRDHVVRQQTSQMSFKAPLFKR